MTSLQTLAALDNAAARYNDIPSITTAKAYQSLAELYFRLGLIDPTELDNILSLILNYSGA